MTPDSNELKDLIRKAVHVLLLVCIFLYLISGFGITNYQLIGPLTFGLLGKALSQQIHSALVAPFVILLLLHLYFVFRDRKRSAQ